jgi:protein farnesyltransferase/geranylgeranyltransferase type-1 subunit alpha
MDVFRYLSFKQEYSERGFELTVSLLDINPASYTVWQYRRECLQELNKDLNDELDFLDEFAAENPKNYQIWHHRRVVSEWLGSGERELQFTAELFADDAKNYHAWAHR